MSFLQFLTYVFRFIAVVYIIYIIVDFLMKKYQSKKNDDNDDEDDIFFDNAPLPKSPSPLPPSQDTVKYEETLEQMQFKAFMKKYKEREKEKVEILRK